MIMISIYSMSRMYACIVLQIDIYVFMHIYWNRFKSIKFTSFVLMDLEEERKEMKV